jgi:hypothetical protein
MNAVHDIERWEPDAMRRALALLVSGGIDYCERLPAETWEGLV